MAAATVAAGYPKRPHVADFEVLVVKFSALADTNTYAVPGSKIILGAVVLDNSTNTVITQTFSGRTATFKVSAGTPDVTIGFLLQ